MQSNYNLKCYACETEYGIECDESGEAEQPLFCPFCGANIDSTELDAENYEEDAELNDMLEELNFNDND